MIRHKLAYWLRLMAWKLDPRPELQANIEKMLKPDPVYPTPEAREAAYEEMMGQVKMWQTGKGDD